MRAKGKGQGRKGHGVHAKAGLPNASFPKLQRHRHSHFFFAIPPFTPPRLRGHRTGSFLPQGPSLHPCFSSTLSVSDLVTCSGFSKPTRPPNHHQNRGSECCHDCVRCFLRLLLVWLLQFRSSNMLSYVSGVCLIGELAIRVYVWRF